MISAFFNAYKVDELRKRLLFVLTGFALFVFSTHLSVPGVNLQAWNQLLKSGEIFNFLGMITGGALNNFAVVAMGITPYINASIIMQLLTVVVPKLEELAKEGGEMGRKKISQYTRWLTIALAIVQGTMMTFGLNKMTVKTGEQGVRIFTHPSLFYFLLVILSLTAGTAFLMWLGEQMTDKGIGNGVSLIIFAGIVLRYPQYTARTLELTMARVRTEGLSVILNLLLFLILSLVLIAAIVMVTQGQRKVPVQYAKRVVGRRVMGGQSTYIPIRINNAGVISIIFAISVLYFPMTVLQFIPKHIQDTSWMRLILDWFHPRSPLYNLFYAGLVIFFTYFYSYITFNIMDLADNMKKYGGFIPGIRPGKPTAEYLNRILSRVTFVSAMFLAGIAVLPGYVMGMTNVSFYLGSTSLLIIVGVVLDTIQQIEARLVMRHYQGFMK